MAQAPTPATPVTKPTPASPGTDATKRKVAEHEYVNAAGAVVDEQEAATGCLYKDVASGKSTAFVIPGGKAGDPLTMLAVFGLKTLFTNTASGARQVRAKEGSGPGDVDAINARMSELKVGQWDNPAAGPTGPRYDLDILATVFEKVFKVKAGQHAAIKAKLETDVKWRRSVTGNMDVKAAYIKEAKIEPAAPKAVDLSGFATA